MDLTSAKQLEEEAVKRALVSVYERHGEVVPQELSGQLAPYVKRFLRGNYDAQSPLHQDLCLALFSEGDVMPALLKAIQDLPLATSMEELLYPNALKNRLASTYLSFSSLRHRAKKKLPFNFFERVRFIWSAFLSSRIGSLIFGKVCPYDPRCFARNIGGRFMVEKISREGAPTCTTVWVLGATPTVGDHISKEALLAIRALSNERSVLRYGLWIYCNLQGTKLASEKNRSQELLKVSRENIDHFRVASVSVDNPWYLDRSGRRGDLLQHRAFIEQEIQAAIAGKASWFAFALKDGEREEWRSCTRCVIEKAFVMAQSCQADHIPIFHELVTLGLIRAWQGFCSKNSTKDVVSTIACKECADRGGSVNASLAWALLEEEEPERIKKVEAILWGRPLLARSRLNEHRRSTGFLAIVRAFSQKAVRTYLDAVYRFAHDLRIVR